MEIKYNKSFQKNKNMSLHYSIKYKCFKNKKISLQLEIKFLHSNIFFLKIKDVLQILIIISLYTYYGVVTKIFK